MNIIASIILSLTAMAIYIDWTYGNLMEELNILNTDEFMEEYKYGGSYVENYFLKQWFKEEK